MADEYIDSWRPEVTSSVPDSTGYTAPPGPTSYSWDSSNEYMDSWRPEVTSGMPNSYGYVEPDRPESNWYDGLGDDAGKFLSSNWKDLLKMFGGPLLNELFGSKGMPSMPAYRASGGGGGGITTSEALAGKASVVTGKSKG